MDATHLTPEQREQLTRELVKRQAYLDSVLRRMDNVGWYSSDPVRLAIEAAHTSIRAAVLSIRQAERLPKPREPFQPGSLIDHGQPRQR